MVVLYLHNVLLQICYRTIRLPELVVWDWDNRHLRDLDERKHPHYTDYSALHSNQIYRPSA